MQLPKPFAALAEKLSRRRARRTPSGLDFVLADRLAAVRPDHWDAVAAHGSVFLSRAFLGALEDHRPADLTPRYGIAYRGDTPVAIFLTQSLEVSGAQFGSAEAALSPADQDALGLGKVTRKALAKVTRRLMVCGNLFTYGHHGVAFALGEDPAVMWRVVAEGLYRLRRADRLQGRVDYQVVKDLPAAPDDPATGLARYSYRPLAVDPNMVLALDPSWGDFDGYLAALTKKYRKAARTAVKKIEKAGARVEPLADLAAHGARVHELYRAVASRSDFRLVELGEGFFPALADQLGAERFAAPAIWRGDELLGYVTVVRDGDTAVGYYLGVDYEANAEMPVYHRLLYAVVEQALAWGCRRISFGGTALEAKARVGAVAEPTVAWVRHRVPLLNVLVRRALSGVPHPEPPERNPFKERP